MTMAKFIYDSPAKSADLYYATKFLMHNPCIFFENRGKKFLVLSDLEIDRAKRVARVDKVLSLPVYVARAEKKNKEYTIVDILHEIFTDEKIEELEIPDSTSFVVVDGLRGLGYKVKAGPSPFYSERFVKTAEERKYIENAQRVVFQAMKLAQDVLKKSRIRKNRLIHRGAPLTSEKLRQMINIFLMERGYAADDTIVACGAHSIDPHEIGSGELKPFQSIIVDIFPRSQKTMFYGDATRTFCKGRAPDALRKLYATVKEGQELGLKMVRAGVNGRNIHEAIHAFFKGQGYETGEKDGRKQGFIHGTGHSIGLEIHEEPARIRYYDYILKKGNIMSVEPGLYYAGIGGARIEDLVYVTDGGCEILSRYPKHLEIL